YLMAWVEPHDGDAEEEYPIPYLDLEVRHLGEMYETILEFTVTLADADRIRRRSKKGVEILLASETTQRKGDGLIRKGEVWFGESALERKQTGSYYTPESLVHFLNAKAVIGPLRDRFEKDCRERFDLFIREAKTGHDVTIRRGAAQSAVALVERFVREVVLRFKLCDPAMGSGHFLVNAANQITDFIVGLLAEIPHVEGMVSPATCEPNIWRRLVTRHCLYGVDMNPLAVHLAKLSLWLNGFARDHKLTFLDHHLRCGNSLIGIRSLSQLAKMPERARDAKRTNKNDQQAALPLPESLTEAFQKAARDLAAIADISEDDTDRQKEIHSEARTERIRPLLPLADLYTAYLMDGAVRPDYYEALFLRLSRGDGPASVAELELDDRAKALAGSHHFFHWPLEFPDVFTGEEGGFDAAVGNPPWDILKPNSQEFFSAYDPQFRSYQKQEANRVAERLMAEHPPIRRKWEAYGEEFERQSEYVRQPSAYRALGKGDINTYKLFLERFYALLKAGGHLGIVTPSGLYTDQGCQPLRELFFNESRIVCLYGFENRRAIFNIHRSYKFILFCTEKGGTTEAFRCAFMEHDPERLPVIDTGALEMQIEHVRKFSPDTLSVMEFKSQRDIDIAAKIYGDWPLLGEVREDSWNVKFTREFDMTNDSHLFLTRDDLVKMGAVEIPCRRWALCTNSRYDAGFLENAGYDELKQMAVQGEIELFLPLWEGKMIWHFDSYFEEPRYWLNYSRGVECLGPSSWAVNHYRVGYRDIAASTNERTLVSTVIPQVFHGNKIPTVVPHADHVPGSGPNEEEALWLASALSSFCIDFLIRQKISTTLNFFYAYSLPVPRPNKDSRVGKGLYEAIVARAARLICVTAMFSELWRKVFKNEWLAGTFWYPPSQRGKGLYGPQHEQEIRRRLAKEAANLTPKWMPACGVHDRKAYRRDTRDRAQLRAEIDAYVARLYGLSRDDFSYILDTFPVLKRKEEQAFGEFMSKRKCLEEYDRITNIL
ncbi:MAG: hypothetical protein ABIK91_10565, partial [Pseudomonadota bacterium]